MTSKYKFLDENGKWKCIGCGDCCRFIGMVYKAGHKEAEGLDRGDGICKHLTQENKCEIYDNRPSVCNTKNFKDSDDERAKSCASICDSVRKMGIGL